MNGAQADGEPGFPTNSVVLVNPSSWAARGAELGQLLAVMAAHPEARVIPDTSGRPPEVLGEIADPSYWSGHIAELGEVLSGRSPRMAPPGAALGVGASEAAEAPGRLTWTVEEAAVALGVSRAFAYDAVRRGEIPAIRIGRRILVPRAALGDLLAGSSELGGGE